MVRCVTRNPWQEGTEIPANFNEHVQPCGHLRVRLVVRGSANRESITPRRLETNMNRDKVIGLAAASPHEMREAMYKVISRSQDRPEVQVQAIAMALMATCDALNIDVKDLLNTVEHMITDLDGPFTSTFTALRAYAKHEIGERV